ADCAQHLFPLLIDVGLLEPRHNLVLHFLEGARTWGTAVIKSDDVPAEGRLHGLAHLARLLERECRARECRIHALGGKPAEPASVLRNCHWNSRSPTRWSPATTPARIPGGIRSSSASTSARVIVVTQFCATAASSLRASAPCANGKVPRHSAAKRNRMGKRKI